MRFQVSGLSEAFLAARTFVGTFAGVRSHVGLQSDRPLEVLAAFDASERSIVDVHFHVVLQMRRRVEALTTDHAEMRTFSGLLQLVYQLVRVEVAAGLKALPALITLEVLFGAVGSKVDLEQERRLERLGTFGTSIRPQVVVYSRVSLHVTVREKSFAADDARVWPFARLVQLVDQLVRVEVTSCFQNLTAFTACIRTLINRRNLWYINR
jgi:hypothetical protein